MKSKTSLRGTLIFGCGYVGEPVADRLSRGDEPVYAVTRSAEKARRLADRGILPITADWNDRRTLSRLPQCKRVLIAVSYDPRSRLSREQSQVGGLVNLLEFLPRESDICCLSTTGVYHQRDGSWVDECSPARPAGAGGKTHLRAEEQLQRRHPAGRRVILRLAGIYGPGRIPRLENVRSETPIAGPDRGWLNLIHRDDAVAAILAAWRLERREGVYLVGDDRPAVRRRFYEKIADLLRAPSPVFAAEGNRELSSRSESNKRVWNRRMRRDLVPRLKFPDYAAGLTDLLG